MGFTRYKRIFQEDDSHDFGGDPNQGVELILKNQDGVTIVDKYVSLENIPTEVKRQKNPGSLNAQVFSYRDEHDLKNKFKGKGQLLYKGNAEGLLSKSVKDFEHQMLINSIYH